MEVRDLPCWLWPAAPCRTARGVPRLEWSSDWTSVSVLIYGCFLLLIAQVSGNVEIVSPAGDSVAVTVGQTLTIRCEATDGQTIRWSIGGMTISDKDRSISEELVESTGIRTSVLTMQVYEVDGGIYVCFNPSDYFERDEILLEIQTAPTEEKVRIVEPDGEEMRVTQGGSFTLKCIGEEGSYLTWFHNGNPLRSTGSRVIITSSIDVEDQRVISLITRHSVSVHDSGSYQCKDSNDYSSADEVRVSVSETPKDSVPVTLVKPSGSSMVVPPGAAFTLQCRGDKRADLTWFINGTLISLLNTQAVVSLMNDDTGTPGPDKISLLTVDVATYDDTGLYSCQNGLNMDDKDEISVRIGHQETEAPVEVAAPTETRLTVLRVGSHMTLQCSLEAPGKHVTEWYKDDRKLTSDAKYVIKQATPTELKIQFTDRQDVGVYRCTFINVDTAEVVGNVIFNLTTSPCPQLTAPKNGSIAVMPDEPVYGDTATFMCDHGFKLTDKRPLVCDLKTGHGRYIWNRATPRCLPLTGGEILQNVPTTLSPVLLRVGGELKLQCSSSSSWTKAGKRLVNGDKYTVEKDSLIITNTVRSDTGIYDCNILDVVDNKLMGIKKFNVTTLTCAKLPTLANGSVDQCSWEPTYGETCVFRCEPGFRLSGSRSQTCEVAHEQSRAYWTGSEKPLCIKDARFKPSGYTGSGQSLTVARTVLSLAPLVVLVVVR